MAKHASPSYEEPDKNVADQPYPVVLPPSKARAGILDRDSLYMLVAGVTLVILLFATVFAYFKPA
jgi:hypothetical protein